MSSLPESHAPGRLLRLWILVVVKIAQRGERAIIIVIICETARQCAFIA